MMTEFKVYWEDMVTGATGHGSAITDFLLAKAWVKHENTRFPYMKHWVVVI